MSVAPDAAAVTRAGARPVNQTALRHLLLNRRAPQNGQPRIFLVRGAPTWNGPNILPGPDGLTVRIATAVSPLDRKSTRLNSSHYSRSRMPSSA